MNQDTIKKAKADTRQMGIILAHSLDDLLQKYRTTGSLKINETPNPDHNTKCKENARLPDPENDTIRHYAGTGTGTEIPEQRQEKLSEESVSLFYHPEKIGICMNKQPGQTDSSKPESSATVLFEEQVPGLNFIAERADEKEQIIVISFTGNIENKNSNSIEHLFITLFERGIRYYLLDLSGLFYNSSAGSQLIARELQHIRHAGGALVLVGMSTAVKNSLKTIKLDAVLPHFDERRDAIMYLNQHIQSNQQATDEGGKAKLKHLPEEVSLKESIRSIIADFGPTGLFKMKKLLQSEEYGGVTIGVFKLYGLLSEIGLESKPKQERYFRAC